MNESGIPSELKALPQWVAVRLHWNAEKNKFDKYPVDAKTGSAGSVSDPSTWASFQQAAATGLEVGFVLTEHDPFCIVDLDTYERPDLVSMHSEIIKAAETYTETSYSGKGSHLVFRAQLDAGLRDDAKGLEIYPSGRFILMTGDVFLDYPIADGQDLIDYLAAQINAKRVVTHELVSLDGSLTDEQVWQKASAAENGHKFVALFNGTWIDFPEYQNDHSRADLGLLTFLDFYTKDVDQVVRLFKYSKLYRPEKGRRNTDGTDYILRTLKAARARNEADQPPPVDLSSIAKLAQEAISNTNSAQEGLENTSKPAVNVEQGKLTSSESTTVSKIPLTLPPGLVGEVAQYIYTSATRPVPEVALMGALALMAGVVGRHFNVSGSGLNLYLILLAPTGTGKEGASSGINTLMNAVRQTVPSADQFQGPAEFASGQGLIKALADKPSMFCLTGEFGIRMQQMAHPRAPGSEKMLERALLNLFSKSGWHQSESGMAYSDREKNTATLHAPALTLFGESPPETFFSGLNETQVLSGLLPRFMFSLYEGDRPPRNKATAFCLPDDGLVNRLANLIATVVQMQANGACQLVQFDSAAQAIIDDFDVYADQRINGSSELHKHLWNRAHLKAMRLAGVIAVGCNAMNPTITQDIAQWAVDFVHRDIGIIEERFKSELVGEGEHRYEAEIRKAVMYYLNCNAEKRAKYKVPKTIINEPIIPYAYLRRRLRQLTGFKTDRRGIARAIQEALRDMCEAGILHLVPLSQRQEKFGLTSDIYVVGEQW